MVKIDKFIEPPLPPPNKIVYIGWEKNLKSEGDSTLTEEALGICGPDTLTEGVWGYMWTSTDDPWNP